MALNPPKQSLNFIPLEDGDSTMRLRVNELLSRLRAGSGVADVTPEEAALLLTWKSTTKPENSDGVYSDSPPGNSNQGKPKLTLKES